ncbi:alpha/beta fold hydrolase [Kitasatospora aureofaciens]|uniref:alpha/beta fold hydrolase n=1 Tax=Kitasatospora aureofaciens TaxID=1894 RepID=UPI0005275F11|nr:alpha/beta hydrolase [Kitasatospora aureofaciens]
MIDRRSFHRTLGFGAGAAALSLTGLQGVAGATPAPAGPALVVPTVTPGTHTSFPVLKQVTAGLLDVGYAELGPADGPVVLCLHGWPYDIHSFVDVAPLLADLGYRVIVPHLRGHGSTRFLSPRTFRNGQQAAVAQDAVALLDVLRIDRAVVAGFDWGSRTGDILAALWPQRVKALVSVSGYLITNRDSQLKPIAPAGEHTWWYQYYFATERGAAALRDKGLRRELARFVWQSVSPAWNFDDATFERTAAAFDNPDYAAVVLHNYRWRLSIADGERRYDHDEHLLARKPTIGVPTVTLDPALDPFTPAPGDGSGYRAMFTGPYEHRTLPGIGHNVPQEAPTAFAQAVVDADHL